MSSITPNLGITRLIEGQLSAEITVNGGLNDLDTFTQPRIISRSITAQPGSPVNGDCYIVPSGATGAQWSGQTNKVAYYFNGWVLKTPREGWKFWDIATDETVVFNGSAWVVDVTRPAGSTTQVQFNNAGVLGASANLTWASNELAVIGSVRIDNQGELRLREASGNGTNHTAVRANANIATNWTMTLPATAGSSGQVLSTDGSGNLSWVANGGFTAVYPFYPADRQCSSIHVNGASGVPSSEGSINPSGAVGGAGNYDSDGPWILFSTAATSGDIKGVMLANGQYFGRGYKSDLVYLRMKTPTSSFADTHILCGFTAAANLSAFGGDETSNGVAAAFFYIDTGGNLSCRTNNGTGTATSSGTVQTLVVDSVYRLSISLSPLQVRFYVDDVLVHTASTDLPGSAALTAGLAIRTAANSVKSFKFGGNRWFIP